MTKPGPLSPFVEIAVFDGARSERDVFQSVLDCLGQLGGAATGRAHIHSNVTIGRPFVGPTDAQLFEVQVNSLARSLADAHAQAGPGSRLVSIDVEGVLEYDRAHCLRITYLRVEQDGGRYEQHPVAVLASGASLVIGQG